MKLKCAVVFALISLAFVSRASAVLRPLFPIKPAAPFNGEVIVIGDDLVVRSAKKPLLHHRGVGYVFVKISTHARREAASQKGCLIPPAFVSLSTHARL
jgi:hypothetical protein